MKIEELKKLLLEIKDTTIDFSIIFSGKKSKIANGLYKPDTHEIILHNRNFYNDNELIYTAIHEYTHHKQCELEGIWKSKRHHSTKFWSMFHNLLAIAEEKGFYKIGIDGNTELEEITKKIRNVIMLEDGKLMKELGSLLSKARALCKEHHVRYEDFIDRILKLPRNTATSLEKMHVLDVDPSIGCDAMKALVNIKNPERRREAQVLYATCSPAMAKTQLSLEKPQDERTLLEKEKNRIERAIENMRHRLKEVEERLLDLG